MIWKQNFCPASKTVFDLRQNHLLNPSSKICFPQQLFSKLLNCDTELFVNPLLNGLEARFTTSLQGRTAWKYVVDLLSKLTTFFSEYS